MEKIGAVRSESVPSSEWMTLRSQAGAEVQAELAIAGAVETAEQVRVLQCLLQRYKDDNENRYRAEEAAWLLSELTPSPADEYLSAITPSPARAADDEAFQVAA